MNLIKCYQTTSTWYKGAVRNSKPVGILWHDTAAGNPTLKRYVQPSDDAPDRDEMLKLLGKNSYNNDWNHKSTSAGLNAWIGKLADGSVATVQAGDWDIVPWGCGTGSKGSCNGCIPVNGKNEYQGVHWIQFEICDDGYKSKDYWDKVYKEACEFTAYICKEFGIDPMSTVEFAGQKVPTILCHKDSCKLGLGSNHSDITKWQKAMGLAQNMDQIRKDVKALLDAELKPEVIINPYEVITTVNMYSSAKDAETQTNVKGHFAPGTYYYYNKYPEGYKGMICLTKDEKGNKDIGWMNPAENVIEEIPEVSPTPEVVPEPEVKPEVEIEKPEVDPIPEPSPEVVPQPEPTPEVIIVKPQETKKSIWTMIFEFIKNLISKLFTKEK